METNEEKTLGGQHAQMIEDIHECLIGTYEKQGLIGRVVDLERQVGTWKRVAVFLIVSVAGVLAEKVSSLL